MEKSNLAMDLSALRQEYNCEGLIKKDLALDPFHQFEKWFKQYTQANLPEPNAMVLATVSERGEPSTRIVLLKYFDKQGFVFFTNYKSKKAQQIEKNSNVALLFPWFPLERQVKIQGTASKISITESLAYFVSRPRGSQIGAWCSHQSTVVSSRSILENSYEELKIKFQNKTIPLPSFWGGYRVVPKQFEFWQGRSNRLHDRFTYSSTDDDHCSIDRLSP